MCSKYPGLVWVLGAYVVISIHRGPEFNTNPNWPKPSGKVPYGSVRAQRTRWELGLLKGLQYIGVDIGFFVCRESTSCQSLGFRV